jgi:hypothetical protein
MHSTATSLKRAILALGFLVLAAGPALGQSTTELTARNNYDQVKQAAQSQDEDARLVAVTADDIALPPDAGEAESWFYVFAAGDTTLGDPVVIAKKGGSITSAETNIDSLYERADLGLLEPTALDSSAFDSTFSNTNLDSLFTQRVENEFMPDSIPDGWIDSDEAVERAEATGGAEYRTSTEGVEVSASLVASPDSLGIGSSISGAAWLVAYRTEANRYRLYVVDAENGNAIELQPQTARTNLAAANNRAAQFAGDAELVYAQSVAPDLNTDGQSFAWRYIYYSSMQGTFREIYVVDGNVVFAGVSTESPPTSEVLPSGWTDSDEAIAAADASENFLRSDSLGALVQGRLSRDIFPTMPDRAFWEFRYVSTESGEITTVYVDALTGEVVDQPRTDATLEANLAGYNEVQPVETAAEGSTTVEVLENGSIVASGSLDGLSADLMNVAGTPGHIHVGGPEENGPVVIGLDIDAEAGNRGGEITADENTFNLGMMNLPDGIDADSVRSAIRNGNAYVNIHTEAHPAGEIRGQILPAPNEAPAPVTITSPPDGASVTIEGDPTQTLSAEWGASTDPDGNEVVYVYQHALDDGFDSLLVNRNVGASTTFTASYAAVDMLLADTGVEVGESVTIYHRANAQDGSVRAEGTARTLNVTRGVLDATPIAEARELAQEGMADTTITVAGVLNSPDYGFNVGNFFIQDETAGINIFSPQRGGNADGDSPFSAGDSVRVTGSPGSFNAQLQLQADTVAIVEDGDQTDVPSPVVIASNDVTIDTDTTDSDEQGERVRVENVQLTEESDWPTDPISSGSGVNVNFFDPATNDTFVVRIDRGQSFYDGSSRPSGDLNVTGTLARFNDTAQIFPWFENDIVDATATEGPAATPETFAVHGSYPNPTKGRARITYDLPQAAEVTVKVYDVMGRRVLTRELGRQTAGAEKKAALQAGRLAAGVYVYRLTANGGGQTHTGTGKITLVR